VLEPLAWTVGRRLEFENKRRTKKRGVLREEEKSEWKGAQLLGEKKEELDRTGRLGYFKK